MRRGLTLIEVLASAVLLTIIAVAVLPLTRAGAALAVQRNSMEELDEMRDLVARFMADPAAFGVSDLAGLDEATIPWLDAPGRDPIHVRAMEGTGESQDVWLLFRSGPGSAAPQTGGSPLPSYPAHNWQLLRRVRITEPAVQEPGP